ncbi:hypothetical protein EDB85DRAFT_1898287 [Lactarius pseudohatsudake]|nr:hypothetical protein EDB85DRAFT_1898287 [Lactarius pseudohatsudake]
MTTRRRPRRRRRRHEDDHGGSDDGEDNQDDSDNAKTIKTRWQHEDDHSDDVDHAKMIMAVATTVKGDSGSDEGGGREGDVDYGIASVQEYKTLDKPVNPQEPVPEPIKTRTREDGYGLQARRRPPVLHEVQVLGSSTANANLLVTQITLVTAIIIRFWVVGQ